MKKLKNHYLRQSKKCAQLHNAEGWVILEGMLKRKSRVNEDFPFVWILQNKQGKLHSFVEMNDGTIVVGPVGVTQVKALDNYLLFEEDGDWYAQYFSKDEQIDIGKPITLNGLSGIKSFLFYQTYVLCHADNNRLKSYDCLRYEKVKFIDDSSECLLVYGLKNKVFLFDDAGKFEADEPVLFCRKASGGGLILRYFKSKKEYKIIYEGKYVQRYHIDEYQFDGEKKETSDKETWDSRDMFIVPDDDNATSGTLYKVEKCKIKKLASGKLRFVSKFTSQAKDFPLLESFVQIDNEIFQIS